MRAQNPSPEAPRVSRATLVGLVLVFVGPLAVAILLFVFREQLPLPAPSNVGQLIDPPAPMPAIEARRADGVPFTLQLSDGKWTLLYIAGAVCDVECESNLFKMRQVRLSLGREMGRVRRVLLSGAGDRFQVDDIILNRYPTLDIATPTDPGIHTVMRTLGSEGTRHIVIIDPLGNAMMRYSSDVSSKDLLKDLKHLLKASQIG